VPTDALRPLLARDGVFNTRDLGGLPLVGGATVRPGLLVRADALHRCSAPSAAALHDHGVRLVLDLRDDSEREAEGVFDGAGIEVELHPVLDPAYRWDTEVPPPPEGLPEGASVVLAHRYAEILDAFADRFVAAVERIATAEGGVAYHCAIGKDRTGLLTALVLSVLGADRDTIVADYARSARATPIQVNWLVLYGMPTSDVEEEQIDTGVWSARPATMVATLDHLDRAHGGAERFLRDRGLAPEAVDLLRERLVAPARPE
jgi:protein-tyrosine phosphatase